MKKQNLFTELYRVSGALTILSMVAVFVIIVNKILASFFGANISFPNQLTGYFLIWLAFLGVAFAMYKGGHIRIEAFINHLNSCQLQFIMVLLGVITLAIIGVLCYYGVILTYGYYLFENNTGELALLWLIQFPMGLGCLLFLIALLDYVIQTMIVKK